MTKLATFQVTQNVIVTYKRWAGVLRGRSMRAKQQQQQQSLLLLPRPSLGPLVVKFFEKERTRILNQTSV
jgi:hypothetical protein